MVLTVLLVIFASTIGVAIGRFSSRATDVGRIVTEFTEEGTKRYTLEVDTDVNELDQLKFVRFKVIPPPKQSFELDSQ